LEVFIQALALAPNKKDGNIPNRVASIIQTLTQGVYKYTCTGIFETHKLMFSLQMTMMIQETNRELLSFFLKGYTSLAGIERKCPAPWLAEQGWKDIHALATLQETKKFANFLTDFCDNLPAWKAWYDEVEPESRPLPGSYSDLVNPFEFMCLLRCFRADRVPSASAPSSRARWAKST